MDFFGYQEQARRNTAWLVFLFVVATLMIMLAVYVAVAAGLLFAQFFQTQPPVSMRAFWNPTLFGWVVAVTLLIVSGGSLYRTLQLRRGGGASVAEMLGGERVSPATDDPLLRRLLNVTEEMAIASGLPVPQAYLLPQSGINAFAAGFSPQDAVIAVTRGALELLNRDQLQGVIAHEISHILHGDTRLKMRLMGLLFGITLISDAGILMLTSRHSVRYADRRRQRGVHPALLVMGFLIFLVGTIGAVFADLIKRAVSRQREYLADAAAVQFTRNPQGLAGALKVIGGYREGSRIRHAAADQASHFFFSEALKRGWRKSWWATHPPLVERIRRLDPAFRGQPASIEPVALAARVYSEAVAALDDGSDAAAGRTRAAVESVMGTIGRPGPEHLRRARNLLKAIPRRVREFAHDPYTARATVYALLLNPDTKLRARQLEALQKVADASVYREVLDIQPQIRRLDAALRLPLLDMLLPALKTLSRPQYIRFRKSVYVLIRSDGKINIFEYMLHRILLRHLKPVFSSERLTGIRVKHAQLAPLADDCVCVLACLLQQGAHANAGRLFAQALDDLGIEMAASSLPACSLARLDKALTRLDRASPEIKKRLIRAAVYCVLADGRLAVAEIELMRAIADALDVPMPPLSV